MRIKSTLTSLAALALTTVAQASAGGAVYMNEIYASHSGTDNMEFIELIGAPGTDLSGFMVLIVEGDGSNQGTLDRVWDLTGHMIPSDGYFVLGDTLVLNMDYDLGSDNNIENGTETFYLIHTTDTAAIAALHGTSVIVTSDTTVIPGMSTIFDIQAMQDDDFNTDQVYDGAPVAGPDGPYLPAGIFRGGDYPADWCCDFLDFDPTGFAEPTTPGTINGACGNPCTDEIGTRNCTSNVNSTGYAATLTITGSTSISTNDLTLTSSPVPDQPSIFFYGTAQSQIPFGDGYLCATGSIVRTGVVFASGNMATITIDTIAAGFATSDVRNFQHWYRDPAAGMSGFNTSDAVEITFFP